MIQKIVYTILGFAVAFVFFPQTAKDASNNETILGSSTKSSTEFILATPELAYQISVPEILSKSAVVYDNTSGSVLYSKNLDEKLPIASLTKLMTALVVIKNSDLDDKVTISRRDQTSIGATMGLALGEQITVHNLLQGLLIPSSNDAALALSHFVAPDTEQFVELMNEEAGRLGLTSTHFANPVGWDSDDNYSNTLDLIKLVQEFLRHEELAGIVRIEETVVSSTDGKHVHKLLTTNKLMMEDSNVLGIKTGFTSKALGNLIILINHDNHELISIVLGSENREEDSRQLLAWIFQVYNW